MKDSNVKRWSRFHRLILRSTGGRIGRRLVDNDMLLLTTIGRRTNKKHTVPLLFLEEEGRLIVIASFGGRDHHPEWYLNLLDDPSVVVTTRGTSVVMHARTVSAEERSVWWPRIVHAYSGYEEYQSKTTRAIPVVALEPVLDDTVL
ncbi:MAG: nitroreductase family deazaflavin-dependent oxidoreductase [Acidimicrobiia bacterium]